MSKKLAFTAKIQAAGGGGAFVRVPFDVEKAFGSKRPKVKAMIDGVAYRGTLVRMGADYHILGVLKEIRAEIGKSFGDEVRVVIELDNGLRTVEIPAELARALKMDPVARAAFDGLAYTQRRELAGSIANAKKPETRARRISQAIEALRKPKA